MTNQDRLATVIKSFVSSEKSNLAQSNNTLVLIVAKDSNKKEIEKAVKLTLGVDVIAVNTVVIKGKAKHRGNRKGFRNDVKKAYVTLAAGQEAAEVVAE